jgi:hypothetical protein
MYGIVAGSYVDADSGPHAGPLAVADGQFRPEVADSKVRVEQIKT